MKYCEGINEINLTAGTTEWVPASGDLATMPVEIRRYGERAWAVDFGGELLCVTQYLKGAQVVKSCLEQMQVALRQATQQADFPITTTAKTVAS